MRRTFKATRRQYERGVIAVEAALVLPILLLFLGLPSISLAIYYRQYTAAQKAVHDAALYLATAPKVEVTTTGDVNFVALTVARNIVNMEMADIVPGSVSVAPAANCTYMVSGAPMGKPCTITYSKNASYSLYRLDVSIGFYFIDPITGTETESLISPYVPVLYVGN